MRDETMFLSMLGERSAAVDAAPIEERRKMPRAAAALLFVLRLFMVAVASTVVFRLIDAATTR